jgi:putative spermidine/putrescine transport system permease protein
MSGTFSAPVVQRRSERWMSYVLAALLVPVIVILLAPSLVVIPMSFSEGSVLSWPPQGFTLQWYSKLFASAEWLDSAKNSVEVAFAATVLCLTFGVPAGLVFGLRNWRGKQLALAFVVAPLVIPTIVLAIGMYEVYAQLGLNDLWGLAAGHAVLGAPFVVITTMSAARQINPVLLLAARSLGARPISVFINITLPIIAVGVLSGAVFAFVTSWDEVVVANFLTSPTFRTIPVQMWNQLTEGVDPTVAAMATMLFAVSMSLMLAVVGFRKARA